MLADLSKAMGVSGDGECAEAVRARAERILRPAAALARLDELAVWLARWQRTSRPAVNNPAVVIFAGDHGVTAEDVSAYPQSVTAAMVEALRSGVATAAVMAKSVGAELSVVEPGGGVPCGNIRVEPALTPQQFEGAIAAGREVVASTGAIDLLVPGEVGIGNTTAASAISAALYGGDVTQWVGPGSGLDPEGVARKTAVVAAAVARVSEAEPIEILRQLGGWELAAMAGAVIEARMRSIPVLLDGFVVTAALMPLEVTKPGFLEHCWPAHVSAEPGHRRLVEELQRFPILDLEMRLGEASGALAALPLLRLAADAVVHVATFEEAGLA